ncbi:MAG: RnfABCDGE type electron transport complex subunit B [Planctomycetota bacterium]
MSPILITVVLACATLAVLAVGMSWILGWANRAFHVPVDPTVEAINNALPGANCGGCGYVGCEAYAAAVARSEATIDLCAPGGNAAIESMADIMGVEATESWPYKAVVHCAATREQRLLQADYQGEPTCAAANLVSGVQGCTYGCLGFGDCATACPYDAIDMVQGVAVVDQEACVGCKICVGTCPRSIISMVPFKSDKMLILACANKDRGKDVKQVCTIGCIGCKACTRVEGAKDFIEMDASRPVIDYDRFDPSRFTHEELEQLNDKCPMERFAYTGRKPTQAELAAVASEDMPERAEAQFKSTVDDLTWWG